MNDSNTNTDSSNVITVDDVVKKKFEKDNNNSTSRRVIFKYLRALILFVKKLITELPDAIKEKGKTKRRKDQVMSNPILLTVIKWLLL